MTVEKVCAICKKSFTAKREHAMYCSNRCKELARNAKEAERNKIRYTEKAQEKRIKRAMAKIKKPKKSIIEIAVLARQQNMHYGEYVARFEGANE
jgi:endogenous inhibitor of DNA gyrase (YacG/DUF329 family)